MQLEQSLEIGAPIDGVWKALTDIERVAPCLPGASISGQGPDGAYEGTFAVTLGSTAAAYDGKLQLTDLDGSKHIAMMRAEGTEKRGNGAASAMIVAKLSEAAAGATLIEVYADYRITGKLARFERGGMIDEIAEKLLRQFSDNLQGMLARAQEDGAPQGATSGAADSTPPAAAPQAADTPAAWSATTPPPGESLDAADLIGGALLERVREKPLPAIGLVALVAFLLGRLSRR